jgi:uncharacterized membrane protein
MQGASVIGSTSVWNLISRYLFYITEFFILVGFVDLVIKRKRNLLDRGYDVLVLLNMALLGMTIIVPHLADSLNMSRFYHIQLFFLAPLCVLGGETFLRSISMKKIDGKILSAILVFGVIIPFFLFQTGFVYEVTGNDSWSLPLSRYRFDDGKLYSWAGIVETKEVFAAEWLSKHGNSGNYIYSDVTSLRLLVGYARFSYFPLLTNATMKNANSALRNGEYVFLRQYVLTSGKFWGPLDDGATAQFLLNINYSSPVLSNNNIIYSNGGSQIYQNSSG